MKAERRAYWRRHLHVPAAIALLPVFAGIHYLGFWVRFEGQIDANSLVSFQATVARFAMVNLAWFVALRVCQGWRRSVAFYDLMILIQAATGALLTMAAIQHLVVPYPAVPRSVLLIDWGTTIFAIGGVRAIARGCREMKWPFPWSAAGIPVLIAGAGDMGASMLRMIRRVDRPKYKVVGFLDHRDSLVGTAIDGVPVLGVCDSITKLVRRHSVQQILVMQGELAGSQLRKLVDDARRGGCEVRVVPNYRRLIEGSVTVQPRSISIDDLLQREPISLDIENVRRWIDGRVVLVTGSAGSIGSEICRQLLQFSPKKVVMVDRSESAQFFLEHELLPLSNEDQIDVCIADVLDEQRMRRVFTKYRPDVVFHAAAYKHVPLMERHPQEAVRNIVTATRRLADLAMEYRAESFVMISTDKAVNPTSVMGACK